MLKGLNAPKYIQPGRLKAFGILLHQSSIGTDALSNLKAT